MDTSASARTARIALYRSIAALLANAEMMLWHHDSAAGAARLAHDRSVALTVVMNGGEISARADVQTALASAFAGFESAHDSVRASVTLEAITDYLDGPNDGPKRAAGYRRALALGGVRLADQVRGRILWKLGFALAPTLPPDSVLPLFGTAVPSLFGGTSDLDLEMVPSNPASWDIITAESQPGASYILPRLDAVRRRRIAEHDTASLGRILQEMGRVYAELLARPDSAMLFYEQALVARRQAKDQRGTALTLQRMALLQEQRWRAVPATPSASMSSESAADSIEHYARLSLPPARASRDSAAITRAYVLLSLAHRFRDHWRMASAYADSALRLATFAGIRPAIVQALSERAYAASADTSSASGDEAWTMMAQQSVALGLPAYAPQAWWNAGAAATAAGRLSVAIAAYDSAESTAQREEYDQIALAAQVRRGELLALTGRAGGREVLLHAIESLETSGQSIDPNWRAVERGRALLALGRIPEAVAILIPIPNFATVGAPDAPKVQTIAFATAECADQARETALGALSSFELLEARSMYVTPDPVLDAKYNAALGAALRVSNAARATAPLVHAAILWKRIGMDDSVRAVNVLTAEAYSTLGLRDSAAFYSRAAGLRAPAPAPAIADLIAPTQSYRSITDARKAADTAATTGDNAEVLRATTWIARQSAGGSTPARLDTSLVYYAKAAEALASLEDEVQSDMTRVLFNDQFAPFFDEWAAVVSRRSDRWGREDAEYAALAVIDQARGRSLSALRSSSMMAAISSPLNRFSPRLEEATPDEGKSLIESAGLNDEIVLTYVSRRDTLQVFLSMMSDSSRRLRTVSVPVPRDTLEATVAAARRYLLADASGTPGGTDAAALNRLGNWLVPPALRALLPDTGSLAIVPDGPIALVPFAALTLPGRARALGLDFAMRYGPSLAVLGMNDDSYWMRSGNPRGNDYRVLAAARYPGRSTPWRDEPRWRRSASVFYNALESVVQHPVMGSLPMSSLAVVPEEGREVAALFGVSPHPADPNSKARLLAALSSAGVVHIAAHAVAATDPRSIGESFILVGSPDERGRAGPSTFLTARELADATSLVLKADLVMLSACNTGVGYAQRSEGVLGLQRAFLAKGAESVIASMWSVSDTATTLLAREFYRAWLTPGSRLTKPEALRAAQRRVHDNPRWRKPAYWAAFQLAGSP